MTQPAASSSSSDHRVQAVLALVRGEPAPQVSVDYGIGRRSLYKVRSRAIEAIREAVKDQPARSPAATQPRERSLRGRYDFSLPASSLL